jgi:hypothetical protein
MIALARATDRFAPQVVAIKFDLPAPEGQFAVTIEADAG